MDTATGLFRFPGAIVAWVMFSALALGQTGGSVPVPGPVAPEDPPARQRGGPPARLFVLAGQSNMEGYGAVQALDDAGRERQGTLTHLVNDPAKAANHRYLREDRPAKVSPPISIEAGNHHFGDPAPGRRKTLNARFRIDGGIAECTAEEGQSFTLGGKPGTVIVEKAVYGVLPDGESKDVTAIVDRLVNAPRPERWKVRDDVWVAFEGRRGPLTVGFGAGRHLFGVELGLGHVVGDALKEEVLLLKAAWGGKSLYQDFRPPSSGGEVGPNYRQLVAAVREALANPSKVFAAPVPGGCELAGLVWWQGWNDGCDPKNAVPEYESNLVNLIHDLRRDLGAPALPVVVAELTGPWVEAPAEWSSLRRAQNAACRRPGFEDNVAFVGTRDFVRPEEESPGGWACHEFNNAETYHLVGRACGEAMLRLLGSAAGGR